MLLKSAFIIKMLTIIAGTAFAGIAIQKVSAYAVGWIRRNLLAGNLWPASPKKLPGVLSTAPDPTPVTSVTTTELAAGAGKESMKEAETWRLIHDGGIILSDALVTYPEESWSYFIISPIDYLHETMSETIVRNCPAWVVQALCRAHEPFPLPITDMLATVTVGMIVLGAASTIIPGLAAPVVLVVAASNLVTQSLVTQLLITNLGAQSVWLPATAWSTYLVVKASGMIVGFYGGRSARSLYYRCLEKKDFSGSNSDLEI